MTRSFRGGGRRACGLPHLKGGIVPGRGAVASAPTPEVFLRRGMPGLAPAGDLLSCSRKKVGKEALPASPALRAAGSPESRPFARRTAKQLAVRNPALTPRCGRPAGPVAKLASRFARLDSASRDGVRQRDRNSPGEPSSLGGSEGNANRCAWRAVTQINSIGFRRSVHEWQQRSGCGQSVPKFKSQLLATNIQS
jgi:hypothetical protein